MAEAVTPPEPPALPAPALPAPVEQAPVEQAPRSITPDRRGPTYRLHFGVGYLALGVVLGAAAVGLAFFLSSGTKSVGNWSSWQPSIDGEPGAHQIAQHVGHVYRLPGGQQLVTVLASGPTVQDLPLRAVAVRPPATERASDISIYNAKGGIMYILCGLGANCAISTGKASLERARLLRREGLELALYTFRYGGDVSSVTAFLPPKAGSTTTYTLFFRKSDLREQLRQPLAETIPPVPRITPDTLKPAEAKRIDALTGNHVYEYKFQQAGDGSPILVLTPTAI